MSKKRDIEAADAFADLLQIAENATEELKAAYFEKEQRVKRKGIYTKLGEETGLTRLEAEILAVKDGIKFDEQNILSYAKAAQSRNSAENARAWVHDPNWKKRKKELDDLSDTIMDVFIVLYEEELEIFRRVMRKIAKEGYSRKMYEIQQLLGYAEKVEKITAEDIDKLMENRWRGATYSERIWGNTQKLAQRVREELLTSFLCGAPAEQAYLAIDRVFQKGIYNARRLIRTEAAYMANIVQLEAYRRMGIKKYLYVAILDMRTSEMCREMNGRVIPVKNAAPGYNFPPLHPWCRSTTRPVRPKRNDAMVEQPFKDMNYQEWLKKYMR